MSYTQLTQEQRYQLYALKKMGHSLSEIAQVIKVHKSTVGRELKRNTGGRGYRPQQAQASALARRAKSQPIITPETWVVVKKLLRQEWSPEQISGRLRREQKLKISPEWIYQYILKDKHAGGQLFRHLRCQKQRRKRYGRPNLRGKLPNARSIETRPAIVQQRKRIGDWETDTMIGQKHQQALVTLTERKSRYTLLGKVIRRTAPAVQNQIVSLLSPMAAKVHTLTSDNGKEFAQHQQIAERLKLDYYFAHPYAAWERGTNENTNGLIRQYFPKKHDFRKISSPQIQRVIQKLNQRPRKCLRYKTPFEVLYKTSVALTS